MKKSDVFLITVDEERSTILAGMCGLAVMFPQFIEAMNEFGIDQDEVENLFNEINKKIHERGWCKSPNCEDDGH